MRGNDILKGVYVVNYNEYVFDNEISYEWFFWFLFFLIFFFFFFFCCCSLWVCELGSREPCTTRPPIFPFFTKFLTGGADNTVEREPEGKEGALWTRTNGGIYYDIYDAWKYDDATALMGFGVNLAKTPNGFFLSK